MARSLRGNDMRTYNSFNELHNVESNTKKNVSVFNRIDCEMDRYGIWPDRSYLTCDIMFENEPEYGGSYPIIYFSAHDSSMGVDELCNAVVQLVDGLKANWDKDGTIYADRALTEDEARWLAKDLQSIYND